MTTLDGMSVENSKHVASPTLHIVNKSHHPLPQFATPGASGMDVQACLKEEIILASLARICVPTGLYVEIPVGYELQLRPRSGWALKKGMTLLNSPGTIDADYRGEIQVLLINLSHQEVQIKDGDRIAQLILQQTFRPTWHIVEKLNESKRDSGGFGSTGLSSASDS